MGLYKFTGTIGKVSVRLSVCALEAPQLLYMKIKLPFIWSIKTLDFGPNRPKQINQQGIKFSEMVAYIRNHAILSQSFIWPDLSPSVPGMHVCQPVLFFLFWFRTFTVTGLILVWLNWNVILNFSIFVPLALLLPSALEYLLGLFLRRTSQKLQQKSFTNTIFRQRVTFSSDFTCMYAAYQVTRHA